MSSGVADGGVGGAFELELRAAIKCARSAAEADARAPRAARRDARWRCDARAFERVGVVVDARAAAHA